MRYQLYGRKIPHTGKSLWEIVGNLKNFGVGRYIQRCTDPSVKEPCFFKILSVQAVPPPRNQFEGRKVIVHVEEWHKGLKIPVETLYKNTDMPKFKLIPKSEEETFIKAAEEISKNFVKREVPKYLTWPPLFKIMWERQYKEIMKKHEKIPNFEIVIKEENLFKVKYVEKTAPPSTSNMYQLDSSVEEKIQEIIRLKRLIKSLSPNPNL